MLPSIRRDGRRSLRFASPPPFLLLAAAIAVVSSRPLFSGCTDNSAWSATIRPVDAFVVNVAPSRGIALGDVRLVPSYSERIGHVGGGSQKQNAIFPVDSRRCQMSTLPLHSVGQDTSEPTEQNAASNFTIRRGTFRDLHAVADLMMTSFYEPNSLMYHYHRMLELDRLQSNFPYDSSRHEFFVACAPAAASAAGGGGGGPNNSNSNGIERIIGFCDVDGRASNRRDAPPRPYLSDLAVHDDWRRRGVATGLVEACEEKAREMGSNQLYLRVEGANDAAIRMYVDRMRYVREPHPVFGVKDTTILLRCCLDDRLELMEASSSSSSSVADSAAARASPTGGSAASNSTATEAVIDYFI